MLLGSTVHEVLEYLYKQLNSAVTPTLEQLLQRFHQTRERDIDREQIVFHEETPEDSFLRRGEIYLRAYRERHAPFGQVQVAMIEGRIVFSLDDQQQLKFRGVVDRLDKE